MDILTEIGTSGMRKHKILRMASEAVLKLHGDGIPTENISSELEMSKSLVREYIEIIEDLTEAGKG